jgi:hypothetical protein
VTQEAKEDRDAIELVPAVTGRRPFAWMWRCRCGATAGGCWYPSEAEAMKAGYRHTETASHLGSPSSDIRQG